MGSNDGESGNGRSDKVPLPLNPDDPLNQFSFSMGGRSGEDSFRVLPGIDGIPHRAKGVRYYKDDDPEHMRPRGGGQLRCETFNTGDDDEKLAYQVVASRIYTMAVQGKAVITAAERRFDSSGSMRVYLEWIEMFTYDPMNPRTHTLTQPGILRRR